MMRPMLLAILLGLSARASAQATDTEIYLAPITRIGDSIVVGTPVNVTRRPGYDNQPSFTADSRSLLYTAQSDGQTDIWRYDIAAARTRRVTSTPESEYSPTQMPRSRRISVVRVERDSTQRLWSFTQDGRDPRLVLPRLKPVGYHAWLEGDRLATFVLGTPSTLHLLNRAGTHDTVIASNIGRALQPLPPGANAVLTYTQRGADDRLRIFVLSGRTTPTRFGRKVVTLSPGGLATTRTVVDSVKHTLEAPYELVAAAPDNEFHVWMPDVMLITASSSVLQRWNAVLGEKSAWLPVADLRPFGVKNVSRLAVSPDGAWLAFVAEPAAP